MEKPIQRICKFASSEFNFFLVAIADMQPDGFKLYNKQNYEYVRATIEAIRASRDEDKSKPHKSLRRPYDNQLGVYPSRSINLGFQSTSHPHTDEENLAQSWCSVTPVGLFNAKQGGHLVLWDLGLAIDFPAGSTALIPSALILHSNTSIQDRETRFSIVQYVGGGLFRWANKSHAGGTNAMGDLGQTGQWKKALNMFTRVDELSF
jgi:hypothetical protein